MLNIGPGQLIMICVIALIVLGPDKLPQAMRTAGQVMTQLRRLSNGFQQDLVQSFMEDSASDRPTQATDRTGRNNHRSSIDEKASASQKTLPGKGADSTGSIESGTIESDIIEPDLVDAESLDGGTFDLERPDGGTAGAGSSGDDPAADSSLEP